MSTQEQVDTSKAALDAAISANKAIDEKQRALLTNIAVSDTLKAHYPDVSDRQKADIMRRTLGASTLNENGLGVSANNHTIADHLKLMSSDAPHLFNRASPNVVAGTNITRVVFDALPASEKLKIINRRSA